MLEKLRKKPNSPIISHDFHKRKDCVQPPSKTSTIRLRFWIWVANTGYCNVGTTRAACSALDEFEQQTFHPC